jgi:hypothetical protein
MIRILSENNIFVKNRLMKGMRFLFVIMAAAALFIAGCGNGKALKEDARKIGDAMCRSVEVMNKLKEANPADSALVVKLRQDVEKQQNEMALLYKAFNEKWGDKVKDEKFTKAFKKALSESMKDCQNLTQEDRDNFKKQSEE